MGTRVPDFGPIRAQDLRPLRMAPVTPDPGAKRGVRIFLSPLLDPSSISVLFSRADNARNVLNCDCGDPPLQDNDVSGHFRVLPFAEGRPHREPAPAVWLAGPPAWPASAESTGELLVGEGSVQGSGSSPPQAIEPAAAFRRAAVERPARHSRPAAERVPFLVQPSLLSARPLRPGSLRCPGWGRPGRFCRLC